MRSHAPRIQAIGGTSGHDPTRALRDPNSVGFWALLMLLVVLTVPYLFAGAIEPLLWGLPLWLLASCGAALAITALTVWRIRRGWSLAARLLDEDD